ncbi:type I restriction enzyme, S subunit [Mariprofundus aestuarium]|uniref:Type I restriction enzyme, S subunit n=1 Tax=Mariprofundus aestuarium TaxID=1921086 RepID=A0A2K8L6Q6_MARES|nr:restriction endonuclease subunit S [Mariprofundus aestuarium]ATX80654.1 type I restriction enzyme, S subunit [Mariprofundus aestuarium]
MTEQVSKVPSLRFPEFNGEWLIKRIGAVIDEYREKSSVNNQYEVLTSARAGLIRQKEYYENSRLTERDNLGFNVIPPNYVTYRSRSDDRRFYFNENMLGITGIISTYYPVFRFDGGANKFFVELFRKKRHYIGKFSVGTSQTVLSFNELKRIKLLIPTFEEQQKISDFLTVVDKRVEQLEEKRRYLTKYKKGAMQQIFSQQIRFKDDNGSPYPDWEEKRLGDMASFHRGKGLSKSAIKENGEFSCILYGQLFTIYGPVIKTVASRTDDNNATVGQKGDILMPSSDVTPQGLGKACALVKSDVLLSGDINIIRPANRYNSICLSYMFNHYSNRFIRLVTGTTVKHLYTKDLKGIRFELPASISEQQKIADFLTSIDDKIEQAASQLEHAKSFKKGLLQQMFV